MNKIDNTLSKSQHKKKLREKRLKDLAAKLKSNILKRKQSKLRSKNG